MAQAPKNAKKSKKQKTDLELLSSELLKQELERRETKECDALEKILNHIGKVDGKYLLKLSKQYGQLETIGEKYSIEITPCLFLDFSLVWESCDKPEGSVCNISLRFKTGKRLTALGSRIEAFLEDDCILDEYDLEGCPEIQKAQKEFKQKTTEFSKKVTEIAKKYDVDEDEIWSELIQ